MSSQEMESSDLSFDSIEEIKDARIARRRTLFIEEGNTTMIEGMDRRIASFAAFKKRRISTILLMEQEGYRIKLAQAKESRLERGLSLSQIHNHIIEMVAMHLNLEPGHVLEGVLDSWLHVSLLNSVLVADGRLAIFFYYVALEPLSLLDSGRVIPQTIIEKKFKRLVVTDGLGIKADGLCVIVYRTNGQASIDWKNCNDDLNFITFEVDANDMNRNVVAAIATLFSTYLVPVVNVTNVGWGALQLVHNGESIKREFRLDVEVFNTFLEGTKMDLLGGIEFETYDDLWLGVLSTPDEVMVSANYSKVVNRVEDCVYKWSRQLTKMISQSRLLRKEKDDVGPMAELEYWRRLLAKFTSIIEFIKSHKCKMYIQCLVHSKSQLVKKWKALDNKVTYAYNEASDNVKYLYALEKYCNPLYRCTPTSMKKHIPSLMYAIRMVYATSIFYNTTERVTAFLAKVFPNINK